MCFEILLNRHIFLDLLLGVFHLLTFLDTLWANLDVRLPDVECWHYIDFNKYLIYSAIQSSYSSMFCMQGVVSNTGGTEIGQLPNIK